MLALSHYSMRKKDSDQTQMIELRKFQNRNPLRIGRERQLKRMHFYLFTTICFISPVMKCFRDIYYINLHPNITLNKLPVHKIKCLCTESCLANNWKKSHHQATTFFLIILPFTIYYWCSDTSLNYL